MDASTPALRQIRICWATDIAHHDEDVHESNLWTPETLETRDAYLLLVKAGNERYGRGTHWLEERDA